MKHILNNLSEEEKNSIREQHTGGMKVMTENFNKLINSKLGDSKPLVNEALGGKAPQRTQSNTSSIEQQTIELGNNLFKLGSDKIDTNSSEFKKALDIIKKSGVKQLTLQGGASSVGGSKYDNQALADRRAQNFKRALVNSGITGSKINIIPGIVTPNTDVPNSPQANKAQFVRFTITDTKFSSQQTSAIDNATTVLPIVPIDKVKVKKDTEDKTGNYYMDVRITFPNTMSSSKILELIKTALKGIAIKVERIDKPKYYN
jgi:outer membrane protein OmpA-like peptidoglycan-associated protein